MIDVNLVQFISFLHSIGVLRMSLVSVILPFVWASVFLTLISGQDAQFRTCMNGWVNFTSPIDGTPKCGRLTAKIHRVNWFPKILKSSGSILLKCEVADVVWGRG